MPSESVSSLFSPETFDNHPQMGAKSLKIKVLTWQSKSLYQLVVQTLRLPRIKHPGLVLFKHHNPTCLKTPKMKRLSATARRFYWECACPIWITGHIPGTGDWFPARPQAPRCSKKQKRCVMRGSAAGAKKPETKRPMDRCSVCVLRSISRHGRKISARHFSPNQKIY